MKRLLLDQDIIAIFEINKFLKLSGETIYSNGNIYEGEFKDGKSNGHGKKTFTNGDTFEGQFKDDKPDESIVTYPNYDKSNGISLLITAIDMIVS